MRMPFQSLGLAAAVAMAGAGCVRETTTQELLDLSRQARMNTVATTIYYTGSDDRYDYFYLDIPLGGNDACKVPVTENAVTNRMPVSRRRAAWRPFSAVPFVPSADAVTIGEGTNRLILVPATASPETAGDRTSP